MKRPTFAAILALLALPAFAGPASPMRLPDSAVPTAYHLTLNVDPTKPTHSGEVVIDLDMKSATSTLRLSATELAVKTAEIDIDGKKLTAKPKTVDDDLIDLVFPSPVPIGHGQLKLAFSGHVQDKDVAGLFRQKLGNDWYAFTQFESTSARMAFPCFDEPKWKTPWSLSLIVPANLMAVGNAPVAHETKLGRTKRIDFEPTRPLPSYLVAFGVGPFDVLDGGTAGHTPIRYITPRGMSQQAHYAASVTPRILAQLESYFGIPYPYEKLDLMALPLTVGFGAMENAGLVTFQQRLLLAKPEEETAQFQRSYVGYAAHELSHQWFGNYVTMAWWDDLWLNESFASWMGDKTTAALMPDWHWDSSIEHARSKAMKIDRLPSARRVHQPVLTNEDLGGAFDAITYNKGQTVLAMFENWLGANRFQSGVRRYLADHALGNATSVDFLAALSTQDPVVAQAFKTFTEQTGIPRVDVALACDGHPKLKLRQSQFVPKGISTPADGKWEIPLIIRTPAGSTRYLLKDASGEVPLADDRCPAWVLANADGVGYYHTVYTPDLLDKLIKASNALTPNELIALLEDLGALTESGDIAIADALPVAERFASHSRREVAEAAAALLERAKPLVDSGQVAAYATVWQLSIGARARALGLKPHAGESDDDRLLRPEWIGLNADLGRGKVMRSDSRDLANAWFKDHNAIDPSVREAVLTAAAFDGDRGLFDGFAAAARSSANHAERADLYVALGSFRDPALAEAARQLLLSPEHDIRESITLLAAQNDDDATRDSAFRFVARHFKQLAARMAKDAPARLPQYFDGYCSTASADEVAHFFEPLMVHYEGGQTRLRKTLETIRLCAAYRGTQAASMSAYLGKH